MSPIELSLTTYITVTCITGSVCWHHRSSYSYPSSRDTVDSGLLADLINFRLSSVLRMIYLSEE